ncbi:MAG: hypothetical protein ACUVS7_12085 [Bryobacteraceae bacterium]
MATLLEELAGWKRRYGEDPKPLLRLLKKVERAHFTAAEELIRLHEVLLFLRAYPHSEAVAPACDRLLAGFRARVEALGEGAEALEEPEVSGIAGSAVTAVFSYEAARALAARYGPQIEIAWEECPETDRFGPLLAAILPAAREEWPVEAHFPARAWVDGAKKAGQTALQSILEGLDRLKETPTRRAELYDSARIMLTWRLGDSPAARTHARRGEAVFFHTGPLIHRRDVSLEAELGGPNLPVRRLGVAEARRALAMIQDTSAVRYRELYGFNFPDQWHVYSAEAGRGVEIVFFGSAPEARLPLRAYHAGMFFKNGVPAGYVEVLSFFERAEVGFNVYYTFRDGETAWIYAKMLQLCRQLLGVTAFWVDPYQIGHENEEAIESGAFWFYRKLGFRPVSPAAARLAAREEQRLLEHPGERTPARILRRLAAGPMIYESPGTRSGDWDRFHIRRLAVAEWPRQVRRAFEGHARHKRAGEEVRYLRALQADAWLREQMLRLGSVGVPEA